MGQEDTAAEAAAQAFARAKELVEAAEDIVDGPAVELFYKEQIDPIRAQHKRVKAYHVPGFGLYVIRKPKRLEHQAFQKQLGTEGFQRAVAIENYVQSCTVVPDSPDAVRAVFEEWALFSGTASLALQELGGGAIRELGKD